MKTFNSSMPRFCLALAAGVAMVSLIGLAQAPGDGPYKVLKTAKTGGDGGFDYVTADSDGRRLYVGRSGNPGRVTVFNLDTLAKVGEIANTMRDLPALPKRLLGRRNRNLASANVAAIGVGQV